MPIKNITQTGPQRWKDLQEQNDELFGSKKDRKKWLKEQRRLENFDKTYGRYNQEILKNGTFSNPHMENAYQRDRFLSTIPVEKSDLNDLRQLTHGQVVALYNRYKDNPEQWTRDKYLHDNPEVQEELNNLTYENTPFNLFFGASKGWDENEYARQVRQELADKEVVDRVMEGIKASDELEANHPNDEVVAIDDLPTIQTRSQQNMLYEKLEEEAKKLFPDKTVDDIIKEREATYTKFGMATVPLPTTLEISGRNEAYREKRAEYIRERMQIPEQENIFKDNKEAFIKHFGTFSSTYKTFIGTKYLHDYEINFDMLYEKNKEYLDKGLIWKVEANVDKYVSEIIAEKQKQVGWGDDVLHGRGRVFLETAAAGFTENVMDFVMVPAGLIYGVGAVMFDPGTNYWEAVSVLPNISHDVANWITGDAAVAYGSDWGAAIANSGYTIGTMIADAALAAIPVGAVNRSASKAVAMATEEAIKAARLAKAANFAKIYGVASSLNFALCEGTVDALDVREGILRNAEEVAKQLPPEVRDAYLRQARHEANTAYGRTMTEEALVVSAGTAIGLGFNATILPSQLIERSLDRGLTNVASKMLTGGDFAKSVVFNGKVLYNSTKLAAGELGEELLQGMASGINTARAEYNLEQYAEALHYGLGSEYINAAHVGVLEGLERFAPQAWTEMDPENLTKQVLASTLLFRSLKLPGKGKSRAQINAENSTLIGKIWDNIAKYSPVQTGIGQIIADAKHAVWDVENSVKNGFIQLMADDDAINVLQSQAALTDIGVLMVDAANKGDTDNYRKLVAAYKAAQAVMLANANRLNTRFGKTYQQVLQNRANYEKLTDEEKQAVLQAFLEDAQNNAILNLPEDEQIKFMIESSQQALDLTAKASEIFERFAEDADITGQDVRPMVFAELLNSLTGEVINNNWANVEKSLHLLNETDENNNPSVVLENIKANKNLNQAAVQHIINNYLKEKDATKRAKAISDTFHSKEFTSKEAHAALNAILNEMEKLSPNIRTTVVSDLKYRQWRNVVKLQWDKAFEKVQRGEGLISDEKSFIERVSEWNEDIVDNPKKKERKFIKKVAKIKSLSELKNLYDEESTRIDQSRDKNKYDIEAALDKITDDKTKKIIAQLRELNKATDSLIRQIQNSNLDDKIKASLIEQIEGISSRIDSVDQLYDISNYEFNGIRPDQLAVIHGEVQNAINKAKNVVNNSQPAPSGHTEYHEPDNTTDLSDRDINTVPPVNDGPLTTEKMLEKLQKEVDRLNKAIKEWRETHSDGTDIVWNEDPLPKLNDMCPPTHEVVIDSNGFFEIKKLPELTTTEKKAKEDEKAVEKLTNDLSEEQARREEQQKKKDADPKSITKVAVVQFEENGPIYNYAVRDEDVQVGDLVAGKFGRDGRIIALLDPQEYERTNPKYNLATLAKYDRPKFIDRHSNTTNQNGNTAFNTTLNYNPFTTQQPQQTGNSNVKETGQQAPITTTSTESTSEEKVPEEVVVSYTAKGQPTRQYTVRNGHIYNKDGKEVFSTPSVNRNKILANVAVKTKQAVVVNHDGNEYVVYKDGTVVSVQTGKIMQWDEENGNRKAIVNAAQAKFQEISPKQPVTTAPTPTVEPQPASQPTSQTPPSQGSMPPYRTRSENRKNMLDNNITSARMEVDPDTYEEINDPRYANIDSILRENGAFDYCDQGYLKEGDEIVFVCTTEEMPDGKREVVIWEVTKSKREELPEDDKFLGYQVLNVLDQTNVGGKRAELISRIREAYDNAGRPESFLYNKETFKVDKLIKGFIPSRKANINTASSNETISSTNGKKAFIKKNGRWTITYASKNGKTRFFPIILRQLKRAKDGTMSIQSTHPNASPVETVKRDTLSNEPTSEVMLVIPTPFGYQAAHNMYVLHRNVDGALDSYHRAIETGNLGKSLIKRIKDYISNHNNKSKFSDYLTFPEKTYEYISYDELHNRTDLGYKDQSGVHTLLSAIKKGDKWFIIDPVTNQVIDENNGLGYTIDEVCKQYLHKFLDDETCECDVQLNITAITSNPTILDDLIEDGFIWLPNSNNGKIHMRSVGFSCSLGNESNENETGQKEQSAVKPQEPVTPKEDKPKEDKPISQSNPVFEERPAQPKQKVSESTSSVVPTRVKRKKLKVSETKPAEISPTPKQEESQGTQDVQPTLQDSIVDSAKLSYNQLNDDFKQQLENKGITQEQWDNFLPVEKLQTLNCIM